jgi:hypothetical protein
MPLTSIRPSPSRSPGRNPLWIDAARETLSWMRFSGETSEATIIITSPAFPGRDLQVSWTGKNMPSFFLWVAVRIEKEPFRSPPSQSGKMSSMDRAEASPQE